MTLTAQDATPAIDFDVVAGPPNAVVVKAYASRPTTTHHHRLGGQAPPERPPLWSVTVRFTDRESSNKTPAASAVTVAHGEELTATRLRDLPWGKVLLAASTFQLATSDPINWSLAAKAKEELAGPANSTKAAGRPPLPPGHYLQVADRYRELTQAGERFPGKVIAKENGVSVSTARGWIYRARKQGFLSEGNNGRAG